MGYQGRLTTETELAVPLAVGKAMQEALMTDHLKPGDKVHWNTSQGETHGTVERKVTGTEHVKGHVAKASPEHPEYRVKSDKSGKEAIHRPEELRKG